VSVTYRDADSLCWYRSSARLTFIRSQSRISFGATAHDTWGPTREAVDEDPVRGEPSETNSVGGNALQGIAEGAITDDRSKQAKAADHLVTAAAPRATNYLQILREAMDQQGLNPPKIAKGIQTILRRKTGKRPKADRSTVYRIMQGYTKKPDPEVREALIQVLKLQKEKAPIVRRGLGGAGTAPNVSEES
jgi:hypothetical protein